jgi:hypothetical protein
MNVQRLAAPGIQDVRIVRREPIIRKVVETAVGRTQDLHFNHPEEIMAY